MSCLERLSAGPECTMKPPLPNLGASLALHCQGLCVLERPLSPFLIAQALHSQRPGPVLGLPLTTTEAHMLIPLGFQRIPALKTKRCFLWIWPSLSPPPYQPRAPKESPTPCLGGSPARPGSPQIDRPCRWSQSLNKTLHGCRACTAWGHRDLGSAAKGAVRTPRQPCSQEGATECIAECQPTQT